MSFLTEDVVFRWDPDIFVGYEIQKASWGFLLKRAAHLNVNLISLLSRVPGENTRFIVKFMIIILVISLCANYGVSMLSNVRRNIGNST